MNYFLEFKKWVAQHPQEKNQVDPSVWSAAFYAWNQEKHWVKALEKAMFDLTEKVPSNSPLRVIHRWVVSGGLPTLGQLSFCWSRLKNLINSWQSKLSNGLKSVEEIRELIRRHTEVIKHAINSADEPSEEFANSDNKKGFYVASSKQQWIAVNGRSLYNPQNFIKINEQLNSLTLIFKPK